jgi:hypothetical protein
LSCDPNNETNTPPAPWARIENTNHGIRLTYSDGMLRSHVADLFTAALCEEHGNLEANARLIAAAPDLLDAVQAIVDAFGDQDSLLIDQCKAALAKATA